jgi:hypothetical protein
MISVPPDKTGRVRLHRLSLGVPYSDKSNIRRWAHEGGTCVAGKQLVYSLQNHRKSLQNAHPATFPIVLANCITIRNQISMLIHFSRNRPFGVAANNVDEHFSLRLTRSCQPA